MQQKESFTLKLILWLIFMVLTGVFYPAFWNVLSKFAGYNTVPGIALFRWDYVLQSADGRRLAMAMPIIWFVVVLYLGSTLEKAKSSGSLVASGSEYGSARWSTDDELHTYFLTSTITHEERHNLLFTIWRLASEKGDTQV